jgi:hypothetical protein
MMNPSIFLLSLSAAVPTAVSSGLRPYACPDRGAVIRSR